MVVPCSRSSRIRTATWSSSYRQGGRAASRARPDLNRVIDGTSGGSKGMRKYLGLCIHAALLLSASAAQGADPQRDGADDSANVGGDQRQGEAKRLDTVIVTAQKRVERLLDVPMSITAVSGQQLVESGVGSTNTLQQLVPGLTTVNNGLGFVP